MDGCRRPGQRPERQHAAPLGARGSSGVGRGGAINSTSPGSSCVRSATHSAAGARLNAGKGKTHRAYMWSYCTPSANPVKAVVFEFSETRSGENVRTFLNLDTPSAWKGTLVTDGFSGYAGCVDKGVTSAQCMAHARRKFHELWVNHGSEVGRKALRYFQSLFRIEREIEDKASDERRRIRQRKSRRILAVLHRWLIAQRQLVPQGSATMKAIDYSLKRWTELTRFVGDGDIPISNNWVENQIRPVAMTGS
ncbi:IS66 family transposase [Comamonas odontotermitis]|uniref:IS66 family transposase n=1 Tax=Comamonas odontotermitis TaxID=379895 RepID=UPI00367279E0